jgi:lipopolysaccharide transport system permease protein
MRVTWNELGARYAGSLLGIAWAGLAPVTLLSIYGVVYLYIFRVQVSGLTEFQYLMYLFSGLVPFLATAEALTLGVSSVVANKSLMANTVFPIDLAPVKAVLLSQGVMLVGITLILIGSSCSGSLGPCALFVIPIWVLHMAGLIGITWLVSLLNVIVRDLQNIMGVLLMILMVISPIAYTSEMVPHKLKLVLLLNPFAYVVRAYQDTLVLNKIPDWSDVAVLVAASAFLFSLGGWFFARVKRVVLDYV